MQRVLFSIFMALFFLPLFSAAQEDSGNAIDKYFRQYVDDERFTVVYISPKLFELLEKLDVEEMELEDEEARAFLEVATDLKGLRILTCEEDGLALYEEARSTISTTEYEVLMTIRDKKEQHVDFLVKEEADKVTELLLLVGGEDEDFVLISFVGLIDLEKVGRLAKTMEQ